MTGIGKTALAERVVANLIEIPKSPTLPYIRFSLDDRSLSPDFSITGLALLRTLGEEPILADQHEQRTLVPDKNLIIHWQKEILGLQRSLVRAEKRLRRGK